MRERKSRPVRRSATAANRKAPSTVKRDYAEELIDLVTGAANSRELPVFLTGFAVRAAEMLQAEWAGVGEILGTKVELYTGDTAFPSGELDRNWLLDNVNRKRPGLEILPTTAGASYCAF
jgi:hypothetical protein